MVTAGRCSGPLQRLHRVVQAVSVRRYRLAARLIINLSAMNKKLSAMNKELSAVNKALSANRCRGMRRRTAVVMGAVGLLLGFGAVAADEVNIYSYRKPQLIQPMLDAFTDATGITVNAVFAKTGMLERLKNEGRNTPADVVLTVDIGRLTDLKNAGLTQPVPALQSSSIPANYRDSDSHWFGLTARARIIVVAKERVSPGAIDSYEALAQPQWKGRVCSRSGKHVYNIALIAMMIHQHGVAAAETWLTGVKANLARRPEGNDRAQVKAIHQGVCDVALINHYYLHAMASDPQQKPLVDAVNVVFPNQADRGTHMNISGMAMTQYAPNRQNALKLMAFLAADPAQNMYAQLNGEYPVSPGIETSAYLQLLGAFKPDLSALDKVAAYRAEAAKMVDRVNYDG